ncbi:putative molybdenum carrier protein [Allorhodopirellula heiligendammensis]|uniref:Molybdenum carrier n=1 Tax=Allorhodopirellula heiligendammensis TaxID=2714739 RepID=A0A5C6BFS2_9BACT|nr:putative molybdenum carrier protein [Allorhodopirellula heiligendammensis]TWU10780.1 putative molybdenum carrier [Allorhodopirellula heiligendammensis]
MHSSSLFAEFDPAPERFVPRKIVSGGQTGVDRGALDAALALGIEHGGWCPAGRLAEDGQVPTRYQLVELSSRYYPHRTEKNVRDSDATLILYRGRMTGGTKLTQRLCRQIGKPDLSVSMGNASRARNKIIDWLNEVRPEILNVAGPRESNAEGIQDATCTLLVAALE